MKKLSVMEALELLDEYESLLSAKNESESNLVINEMELKMINEQIEKIEEQGLIDVAKYILALEYLKLVKAFKNGEDSIRFIRL